ncbi:MAG TPA: 6-hydroxymethylpterin diphosphokinase MptE-like protein [Thermoplasmata archaeon]|nr:6-hydroxymethylpterin diphosphokinase MptE-like protein [Thermoplasmata archaeon]
MDFEAWEPFYVQILKDFGFSRAQDEAVAAELDKVLGGTRASDADLRRLLRGKEVTVAGNGPNIGEEIDDVAGVLLTADEATSVALANGKLPAILVTDLDGTVADQVKANQEGTVAVVHGHGDNGPAIREWAPRFGGMTVATTQSRPIGGLRNFGGFTDGDRAVFLADHFGARRIHLVGFDFERPNKKDLDARTKQRKLDWAYILLSSIERDDLEL